jgi:hypothetical protein
VIRIKLAGDVVSIAETEVAGARRLYLARHDNRWYWMDFEDFFFTAWTWWTFITWADSE